MDTWSSEQVDNMKSHGNLLMNKIFNPKNIKPPVPTDIDEADSCMERFIRQKYQYRSLEDGKPKPPSREDESYTRNNDRREERRERQRSYDDYHRDDYSPEGSPPPLPPKSGKFFGLGLRSASSTSNLRFGSKSKASASPTSQRSSSPPRRKTSGLGAPVADVTTASFEAKMAALRDMGFNNDRRNEMVLRGLNENLDKSIETLVRLGEGSKPVTRAKTPVPTSNAAPPAGASVVPKSASPNPFDKPTATTVKPAQQQPQTASYNPFDRPTQMQAPQPTQGLEASFQNLRVSQPLFPHSTGGYPAQTGLMPQPTYQQPITPPATSSFSQNGYVSSPQAMDSNYNPFFQPSTQPQGGMGAQSFPNPSAPQNNPFFNTTPQSQNPYLQPQAQQNGASMPSINVPRQPQHANTMPAMSSSSPFGTSPFGTSPFGQAPSFQSQPQQQQQQPQQQQPQQFQQFQPPAQAPAQGSYNPFQQSIGPQGTAAYPNQPQLQQPQQLMPQHTSRMDKNSILSLYSLNSAPSTISSIPEQSQSQFQPGAGTSPVPPLSHSLHSTPITQPSSNIHTPQPSANGSAMASRNPFGAATVGSGLAAQAGISAFGPSSGLGIGMGTNGVPAAGQANGVKTSPFSGPPPATNAFSRTHMSQPSVDINGLQSGRHSPDAFASLSARYG